MKKILFATIAILLTVGSFGVGVYAATRYTLIVNGQVVTKAEVKVINGATYVPLRAVAELLGSDVNWSPSTNTITMQPKGHKPIDSYIVDEFVLTQLKVENFHNNALITVDISNTGKINYQDFDLSMSFFDYAGNRIAAVTTNVFWLKSGEQQLVQVFFEDVDLTSYDYVRFSVDRRSSE
ncbi:copper amine oxidase N-terminal domain-containing protein [Paenibacillus silvae]|uniref:copper amine oxidase N-terminal domain-containing protein n=1 Tax=Paenibacillus silvae TaxID=1325358 RepID=UPI001643323E|nr:MULTISPECIES: copper amine oxidase N-terminal domain-containing protein [Paenibacillus]MCK6074690.1 copper amine oxidase N-terminal domain-containing protein [Paenibacillus silvae]MCK6147835.1 copper amine oxidase N-terminal domain-containing protein [Paenibacillus silvae]MCK6266133.1 copper amine oxidase N-terminal domain-containing protein [Paenibacillus silvae]